MQTKSNAIKAKLTLAYTFKAHTQNNRDKLKTQILNIFNHCTNYLVIH